MVSLTGLHGSDHIQHHSRPTKGTSAQPLPGFRMVIFPKARLSQELETAPGQLICKVMVTVAAQPLMDQPFEAGPHIPAPVLLRRIPWRIDGRIGDGKRRPEVSLTKLTYQSFRLL